MHKTAIKGLKHMLITTLWCLLSLRASQRIL